MDKQPWCVRVKDGPWHVTSGGFGVPHGFWAWQGGPYKRAACGDTLFAPEATERREPDCEDCKRALAEQEQRQ